MTSKEFFEKFYGAWWGAFIGDALAMPSHGYSSSQSLKNDYGYIKTYMSPKETHPDSTLRSIPVPYLPPSCDCIGGDRAKIWRMDGAHPHFGFAAGENTLPLFLALHMTACMGESGCFDLEKWMSRYRAVMTAPDGHRDVFIPTVHRRYFENIASGKDPDTHGCPDAHMSDIAIFIPLMFTACKNSDKAQMNIVKALRKFTVGEGASSGAFFISELLAKILRGATLEDAIYKGMTPDRHVSLAFPYRRWIKNKDDEQAINSAGRFAVLEEAIPLSLYISLKYGGDFAQAVTVNANIGGESTGRGAIIGLLSGAQCGLSKIPRNLIEGLRFASEIQAVGEILFNIVR